MSLDTTVKSPSTPAPKGRSVEHLQYKENFDYEGRVRVEQNRDVLVADYSRYLEEHPEITEILNDMVLHLLILKPDNPLQEMRSYMQARLNVL
ncbi:unnamed protein product [Phytomonas sp. EM1]|nr:unnamed protein product [Phytomonas sp. EM1]|eukprot:CCW65449.1 unnamed protein product [Phytomonas sp. isolate EM1]